MVDIKIINKSLNEAILKCSDGWNLSNKVKKEFNNFAENTRDLTYEKMIMVDKQGNIIFTKDGDNHSINITDEEEEWLYENYRDLDVDHNHPTVVGEEVTTCLSWEDMENPISYRLGNEISPHEYEEVYYVKSVTAEAPNHSRMSLIRNHNFNISDNGDDYNKARTELVKAHSNYKNKFTDKVLDYCITHVLEYKEKHPDAHIRESDFRKEAEENVIKELGHFEETSEYKNIQDLFRKANCTLNVEWTK